jgi:hypothetical protein
MRNPAARSASPHVIGLACDRVQRAGINKAERITTMPGAERAVAQAGGAIGEDLRAVEIEHWQIHDDPDHLPDGIAYFSLYRLNTPGFSPLLGVRLDVPNVQAK